MVPNTTLLTHLDYTLWASSKLLDAATRLTPDQISRDLRVSHTSVLATLQHIYYADRTWLARLTGQQIPFADLDPGPSLDDLKEAWPRVIAGLRSFVESSTDLETDLTATRLNGATFTCARWKIILHVVNHATLHRGQVMAMLRQLDQVPPATDLFYFYLQQNV